jgi:hypothetical protein
MQPMTYPISVSRAFVSVLCVLFVGVLPVAAQESDPSAAPGTPTAAAAVAPSAGDDDAAIDLAQPDFTVVNLPTTMRLPLHAGAFHLTHRFDGNLEQGTFDQQASNLFGLDDGATISFEYRYAVAPHLEVVASRTSFGKTIELYRCPPGLGQPGVDAGPVGQGELALSRVRRAGECAANMAEELRLEQGFGNGRTVHLDERPGALSAAFVDRAGDNRRRDGQSESGRA